MDQALNVTVDKTIHFRNILDSTADNLGLLGGVVSTQCNAQLIESVTGIDLMSPSIESATDIASDGLHSVGIGMAGALQIVNSLTSSVSWEVFQKILAIAGDFTDLVNPLMKPLKPITDLLKKEIRVPWIGSIYKKENLGKVQCRPHQQVGYYSTKGTFGDKCWENVSSVSYGFLASIFIISFSSSSLQINDLSRQSIYYLNRTSAKKDGRLSRLQYLRSASQPASSFTLLQNKMSWKGALTRTSTWYQERRKRRSLGKPAQICTGHHGLISSVRINAEKIVLMDTNSLSKTVPNTLPVLRDSLETRAINFAGATHQLRSLILPPATCMVSQHELIFPTTV